MKMNNLKNAVRIGHFSRNLSAAKKNLNFVKDSNLPKKDYKKNFRLNRIVSTWSAATAEGQATELTESITTLSKN